MEYPPVKPHLIAIHELRKEYQYDKFKASFDEVLKLAGDDPIAQLEVCLYYYDVYATMGSKGASIEQVMQRAREIPSSDRIEYRVLQLLLDAEYAFRLRNIELFDTKIDQALSLLDKRSGDLYFQVLSVKRMPFTNLTKQFDQAIKLCKEIIQNAGNLFDLIASASTHLGIVYCIIGEHDEAESAFQHTLTLFQQLEYKSDIAIAYSNLGEVARLRFERCKTEEEANKNLQVAIHYTNLALETLRQGSATRDIIITLSNLGILYAHANNSVDAVKYGQEALSLARTRTSSFDIAIGLFHLGKIQHMAGQFSEALTLLEECIPYAPFLPGKEKVLTYKLLSLACSNLGLFEKGLAYSQMQVQLQEEFDEKEKEGALYHNKLLVEKLHQQEVELHQLQLKAVEEKMRSQTTQLISQTELLANFRDELREIARQYAADTPGMRAVKEKLKELPCSQIDWAKFESQFNEVHPEFRSKLAEIYPELTEMERRIAIMVRMDLKSVNIAKLFCITERAVEFHRLNLRKKLALKTGETLPKFLQGI